MVNLIKPDLRIRTSESCSMTMLSVAALFVEEGIKRSAKLHDCNALFAFVYHLEDTPLLNKEILGPCHRVRIRKAASETMHKRLGNVRIDLTLKNCGHLDGSEVEPQNQVVAINTVRALMLVTLAAYRPTDKSAETR